MGTSFKTYKRDVHSFVTDTKGRHFVPGVSIHWTNKRNWQVKGLGTWKVTQLNLPRQESVNGGGGGGGGGFTVVY